MRIKKLEIQGFKSFKDRTVIHFDAGITGVVGPNGCGKSNIVDALVWVMGEMSAKHLRGNSMEDVIFAGADGYAPMGLAEVSLTLENDGGPFPVKYMRHSEIMVTRRLYRGGDSEYLLNKEPARLRDIQEVFMDTGAGSKGFSIVEQGAIGRIVTAKPEERRTLIEEAAGITKFKARKRESQKKLQSTEQNLVRLADILSELKRQIDSLQRQAQRAERYRKLKNEIEELEMWLNSNQFLELKERSIEADEKHQLVSARLEALENEIATLETEIEGSRGEILIQEADVREWQEKAHTSQVLAQQGESEIQRLRFEIEQARQKKEIAGSLIEENQARAEVLGRDLERVTAQLEAIRTQAEQFQSEYKEKKSHYDEVLARVQEVDRELTDARREFLSVTQAESSMDAKVQNIEEIIEQLIEEEEKALAVQSELNEQNQQFEKHRNKVFNELEKERQLHLTLTEDVKALETQKYELGEQISGKKKQVDEFKDNLNRVASRLYGLENLQDNMEGFQEGVKTVMFWQKEKLKTQPEDSRGQALRPMAEVVEVPKEYELAMEAALGPRLQMLLSPQNSETLEAVQYLKEKNKGRSSFYSLDLSNASTETPTEPKGAGFKTLLKDAVKYPESYETLIQTLLGQVAVVDTLDTAFGLRDAHPQFTYVTVEGDVLSNDGILTAGGAESADSGVLKRRREIKELALQKTEWSGKLALSQEELKKLEDQHRGVVRDLEEAQKRGTEHEILLGGLKKDFERANIEVENAHKVVQRQQRQIEDVQARKNKRSEELLSAQDRLNELQTRKSELGEQVESAQFELLQSRQGIDDLQLQVTHLQIESARRTQEYEGLNREYEMVSRNMHEAQSQLTKMTHESDQSIEKMSGSQIALQEKQAALEKTIRAYEEAHGRVSELRNAFEEKLTLVRSVEERINLQRREQNQLSSKAGDLRLELEQAKMKEAYLIEQMRERYMVDLAEVAESYRNKIIEVEHPERELKERKEKLSKIGDVNLSAIEEYDETAKRYEFLKNQQDDLNEAKEELRKVIDRINRICARRFRETFEAVNERFMKVFPVLFGGGEAKLILLEDAEKGEMGIDIVAKPPGKKSQSVTLLSGGEKALTAVSLIFSIFLVKPSPYCLLDEVDAPLDDANVLRFNDLVREMAKRSQIIVVTHNKNTMQVAHKLYGVTMEEKGVSKMVSVSLGEEVAAFA